MRRQLAASAPMVRQLHATYVGGGRNARCTCGYGLGVKMLRLAWLSRFAGGSRVGTACDTR